MHHTTAHRLLVDEHERLAALQLDVLAGIADDLGDGELSHVDQHPADVATELFEREKDLSLAATIEAEVYEVGRALARLEAGIYGRCERCGRAIADDRLVAVPATRFCINHEQQAEGNARLLDTAVDTARAGLDRRDDRIAREAAGDLDIIDRDAAPPEAGGLSAEEAAITGRVSADELELAEAVDQPEDTGAVDAADEPDDGLGSVARAGRPARLATSTRVAGARPRRNGRVTAARQRHSAATVRDPVRQAALLLAAEVLEASAGASSPADARTEDATDDAAADGH